MDEEMTKREKELEEAWREGKEEENAACAEIVRAAGCLCGRLAGSRHRYHYDDLGFTVIDEHDPRCPVALLAAIEARKESK